ncbi:MAG: nucleoside-diphosphate sugar epimerase/dehydratase, partial [Stygiobacter sp.]
MDKKVEKILVLLIDFITINLAWFIYFYLRVETGWFELISQPDFFLPMIAIYFYWLIIFTFVGMYRTWFASSRFDEINTLFKASFVGIFIIFFLILYDDYSRGVQNANRFYIFFYWGIFLFVVGSGRILIRSIQRNLLIKGIGRRNALIVGFNDKAKEVCDSIFRFRELGLDLVGFISINENEVGKLYKNLKVIDV